jgi:exosortase
MDGALEKARGESPRDAWELGFFWLWLALAWSQVFFAASYSWRFAEYYDHGWFVPPLAGLMFWRRIRSLGPATGARMIPLWLLLGLILVCAVVFLPARVLGRVDPRWTLPLWALGLSTAALTHVFVGRGWGWHASLRLVPCTMLALCALALPTALERVLVTSLTQLVLAATQGVLEIFGMPVEVLGDRLLVNGMDVTVTKGCSGIRSGNAFLMAALFFGEWMNLTVARRIWMLGLALVAAWAVNVGRATTLAVLRFRGGSEAMEAWHDNVGFGAYILGSLLLLAISAQLEKSQRHPRARVQTTSHSAP